MVIWLVVGNCFFWFVWNIVVGRKEFYVGLLFCVWWVVWYLDFCWWWCIVGVCFLDRVGVIGCLLDRWCRCWFVVLVWLVVRIVVLGLLYDWGVRCWCNVCWCVVWWWKVCRYCCLGVVGWLVENFSFVWLGWNCLVVCWYGCLWYVVWGVFRFLSCFCLCWWWDCDRGWCVCCGFGCVGLWYVVGYLFVIVDIWKIWCVFCCWVWMFLLLYCWYFGKLLVRLFSFRCLDWVGENIFVGFWIGCVVGGCGCFCVGNCEIGWCVVCCVLGDCCESVGKVVLVFWIWWWWCWCSWLVLSCVRCWDVE